MSYRLWRAVFGALSALRGRKMDRSITTENLSESERETIRPYVEYLTETGPPRPLVSLFVWGGLGLFVAFTGAAIMATKSLLGGSPAVVVGFALAYVAKSSVYERKKKQKELYGTLLENPRRLLEPDYRARFDDLVGDDESDPGTSPSSDDPGRARESPGKTASSR